MNTECHRTSDTIDCIEQSTAARVPQVSDQEAGGESPLRAQDRRQVNIRSDSLVHFVSINQQLLRLFVSFRSRKNNAVNEKQLTRRTYKKELKSAIKEIRQDNRFLARVQFDEQKEK